MRSKANVVAICIPAVMALMLAGCGAPTLPDEDLVGLAGSITAGAGADTLALRVFTAGGDLFQGDDQSGYLDLLVATLDFRYSLDYFLEDSPVADPDTQPWDEVIIEGTAELSAYPPGFLASYELDVRFDATGFHDEPDDGRIVLDGNGSLGGSIEWTDPVDDLTAGYTVDLDKTWTGVGMDDPSDLIWTGVPTSGSVLLIGSIERTGDEASGILPARWEGSILVTFDGDDIVPVSVNGWNYLWNVVTGEVTRWN
jgi:hypothetical protein